MSKEFAWSYSKLKNFEACPKRHYEVDLAKNYSEAVDPDGPLAWGNRFHEAVANALKYNNALPVELADFEKWLVPIRKLTLAPGAKLYVEQKYAIRRDFKKTTWFGHDVWLRSIADFVVMIGSFCWAGDWKTGKMLEDHAQMMLLAQNLFSNFPELTTVRTDYIWIKDDCHTVHEFSRQDVADEWLGMLARSEALEGAAKTMSYPPKPGKLCRRYCPVTSCPFHGKGARQC